VIDIPVIDIPLPRSNFAGKSRSIVPAPTVVIHGGALVMLAQVGPSFPAEEATNIPPENARSDTIDNRSR
jgi:hypothetical protein